MQTLSVFENNHGNEDRNDGDDDSDDACFKDKNEDITWSGRSMVPSITVLFHIRPGAGQ